MASSQARPPASRAVLAAAGIDAALVIVFVVIGRRSHAEGITIDGVLGTAWPFLAGLALGWLVARAWRNPRGIVHPGLVVWAVTVVAGLGLRALAGQGVQPSFAIVTALVLGAFLIGWRALAVPLARRSRATRPS